MDNDQLSFGFPEDKVPSIPNVKQKTFGFIDVIDIVREYFPDAGKDELEYILTGETGFPSFWRIGVDGATPEECLRNQLLRALARRKIQYNNMDIIESDPYVGCVSKVLIRPDRFSSCTVGLADGTEIGIDYKGVQSVTLPDSSRLLVIGGDISETADQLKLPDGHYVTLEGKIIDFPYEDTSDVIHGNVLEIKQNRECIVIMPDGSIIRVNEDGSYQIDDRDAKVIYKPNNVREFNKYINASDILEDFIRFAGRNDVTQAELMNLPVGMFINWLIAEAAKADNEPAEADPLPAFPVTKVVNLDDLVKDWGVEVTEIPELLEPDFLLVD